jgi:hypothetical protein
LDLGFLKILRQNSVEVKELFKYLSKRKIFKIKDLKNTLAC